MLMGGAVILTTFCSESPCAKICKKENVDKGSSLLVPNIQSNCFTHAYKLPPAHLFLCFTFGGLREVLLLLNASLGKQMHSCHCLALDQASNGAGQASTQSCDNTVTSSLHHPHTTTRVCTLQPSPGFWNGSDLEQLEARGRLEGHSSLHLPLGAFGKHSATPPLHREPRKPPEQYRRLTAPTPPPSQTTPLGRTVSKNLGLSLQESSRIHTKSFLLLDRMLMGPIPQKTVSLCLFIPVLKGTVS